MLRFLRHGAGVQWENNVAPDDVSVHGPDAPLAHHRPEYSLPGCSPADSRLGSTRRCALALLVLRQRRNELLPDLPPLATGAAGGRRGGGDGRWRTAAA